MPTVLIGSGPLRREPGRFREILQVAGFDTIEPAGSGQVGDAELREALPLCDAAVAGGEAYDAALLESCPRLRVIARTGVGYDAIDVDAATRRGVVVTITPGTNQDSVAEQAFALLLGVCRRVPLNDRIIREGGWDRTLVAPLRGKTLGLVGLGRIGRAMVPRARAFGMEVVAFDVTPPIEADAALGLRRVGFDELLAASDVVSLHMPLTPATRGLINREVLARMRPGSYLINTARGGVLVEADLHDALTSGHLAGAGLDVTDPEPPRADHPLFRLPNVVLSPHIAGIDTRAMADMAEMAARCIADLHAGRWPEACVVNPEVRAGWRW
jgi:phosphoglycerate dehydrogenase-like enzyme